MKRIICLSDWDGTLRQGYTILDWSEFLARRNRSLLPILDEIHGAFDAHRKRQLAYDLLVDTVSERYAHIETSFSTPELGDLADEFVSRESNKLAEFVDSLRTCLRNRKIDLFVVTGSPQVIVDRYRERLGIRKVFGLTVTTRRNAIEVSHFGTKEQKATAAQEIVQRYGSAALALGDSCADVSLFNVADAAVVVQSRRTKSMTQFINLRQEINRRIPCERIYLEDTTFPEWLLPPPSEAAETMTEKSVA